MHQVRIKVPNPCTNHTTETFKRSLPQPDSGRLQYALLNPKPTRDWDGFYIGALIVIFTLVAMSHGEWMR
jgi:hypothetical protein